MLYMTPKQVVTGAPESPTTKVGHETYPAPGILELVRKDFAAKHRRQKFAAVREFRLHGIILQRVRSNGPGPIVILAFRNDNVFPLRRVRKLSAKQLKSILV